MIKNPFLGPMLAGFVAISPSLPASDDMAATTLVVMNEKAPQAPPAGDELERLRGHLRSLNESLVQTQKAVESVAGQRDAARAKTKMSEEKLSGALKELDALKGTLGAVRKEAAQWRNKAQTMEMTHADLEKFRGDLRGAMSEFDHLKNDFEKARTELKDPIERAELKKAMAAAKKEQEQLKKEIEIALQARDESAKEAAKVQQEWEKAMRQASRYKSELEKSKAEVVQLTTRLADAEALNQQNVAKLRSSEQTFAKAEALLINLHKEQSMLEKKLVSLSESSVVTEEMQDQKKAIETRLTDVVEKLKTATREKETLQDRNEQLALRLKERGQQLALVRERLKKREAEMEERPEQNNGLSDVTVELEKTKKELSRVQGVLSSEQKTKGQMERKLVEQSTKIKELENQLRTVEENEPAAAVDKAGAMNDVSHQSLPIPKAIIIYEG